VETDVSTGDSRVPAVFSLSQNYPNPFNPTSVIRYQLPFQSNVTLVVYDVLGREVRRLVDQVQEAGYKSIGWDATNPDHSPVSSGIYLYRIEATSISDVNNTFVQTRKMILVR
jgi:hypothetical protein